MSATTLQAEIVSIVFHNPENDYVVARARAEGEPGQSTVVGIMPQVMPGEQVRLEGEWREHPKFGRQFHAVSHTRELPATINGIRRYLASGRIKGVGPVMAERLVQFFGKDVLDILDNAPERLLEVEGLGKKTLEGIKASWDQQREVRNVMLFLQSHDVPPTYAGRIFARYGNQAVEKLQQNPYELAYEIRGIGFKTADTMALKIGFQEDSPERLEAGLVYTLFQFAEQGHMFYPGDELVHKVTETLGVGDTGKVDGALARLEERKRVVVEDLPEQAVLRAVFLRHFHNWEAEIASRLTALVSHPAPVNEGKLDSILPGLEQKIGVALSSEQKEAVFEACANKTFILTGGPGTGKTTITQAVVRGLGKLGYKIKLAAPTGRAAKRLSEATGASASTLHRLLGFSPDGAFAYNEEKKLKVDALVVDEASMLDCQLCVHLLRALPLTCRLILVGDVHQLPSVGAGNILEDLLESRAVPSRHLTHIFRQAQESLIVVNAHRFNEGLFPTTSAKEPPEADFFWVEQDDPARVQEIIRQLVCERIPAIYGLDPLRDVQVLSPMHKGEVGTQQLNTLLQQELNPSGPTLTRGNRMFRQGDRVLQTRNNYEKDVFNGDLGWITAINADSQTMQIDFEGRDLTYEQGELDELTLAYAVSVHKSQGSEYPAVVLPVVTQHFMLLQRNLIYTALTRAKSLAVLVGSSKALGIALNHKRGAERYTHLRYRLQDAANDIPY